MDEDVEMAAGACARFVQEAHAGGAQAFDVAVRSGTFRAT